MSGSGYLQELPLGEGANSSQYTMVLVGSQNRDARRAYPRLHAQDGARAICQKTATWAIMKAFGA